MLARFEVPMCWPNNLFECDAAEKIKWWVLYLKSRREKVTAKFLQASNRSYFLPLVKKISTTPQGRKMVRYLPFFPNYIFVAGSEETRLAALKTNNVSRSLLVQDVSELVEQLRSTYLLLLGDRPVFEEPKLVAGDMARVKSGPMKGVVGTLVEKQGDKWLVVGISLLNKGISIEVSEEDLVSLEVK